MQRVHYDDDHRAFAELAGDFAAKEVAVFGIPHPRWVEAVVAAVVVRGGADASEDDLIAHSRTHLAGYKTPKQVFFVDSLPEEPQRQVAQTRASCAIQRRAERVPLTGHRCAEAHIAALDSVL